MEKKEETVMEGNVKQRKEEKTTMNAAAKLTGALMG